MIDQPFADRIHADVVGLLLKVFVVAQAMVKEAFLSDVPGVACGEPFPGGKRFCEIAVARTCDEGVKMVGHEQPQRDVPTELLVVAPDCGEKFFSDYGRAELVGATSLAAQRDKVGGVANPIGRRVMEPAALRQGHD